MSQSRPQIFHDLATEDQSKERIIIVGGGIVGSALAYFIGLGNNHAQIILFDDPKSSGSTAYAPGFVGQFNSISHLTEMAKSSVEEYLKIPGAFDAVGGLEIASTPEGTEELFKRQRLAGAAGLPSAILTSQETEGVAPDFHTDDQISKSLHFPRDGTANPIIVAEYYQDQAKSVGVSIIPEKVESISPSQYPKLSGSMKGTDTNASGHRLAVQTSHGELSAHSVILTTGIWTAELLRKLQIDVPIIPVLHSYAHGPRRETTRKIKQPFVRWPEKHVYARDHGLQDGFGTYDHKPIPVLASPDARDDSFDGNLWIETALSVFPNDKLRESKSPYSSYVAKFSVTPDGLPLAGAISSVPGLYVAAAVWVTHAAGVAKAVANLIAGNAINEVESQALQAFNPTRFRGQDSAKLEQMALGTYNNIYNKDTIL